MKKLLTLALAVVALATVSSLAVVHEPKSSPTGVETQKPATGQKQVDKASTMLMTGEVVRESHTFTVMSNGKEVTFNAAKLEAFPKVGETILVTYNETPDGPMTTSIGKRPAMDPCAAVRCAAPKVCGLDEKNQAVCIEKTSSEFPRWCCWFGECRIGCGDRGYTPHW